MILTGIQNFIFAISVVAILASCGQSKIETKEDKRGSKLTLGMSVSEVKEFLDANGVDLYFKNNSGRYVALDKEYEEEMSGSHPASPTKFFPHRLMFNEDDELSYAKLEISGEMVELGGSITLDLDSMNDEAEQIAAPNP